MLLPRPLPALLYHDHHGQLTQFRGKQLLLLLPFFVVVLSTAAFGFYSRLEIIKDMFFAERVWRNCADVYAVRTIRDARERGIERDSDPVYHAVSHIAICRADHAQFAKSGSSEALQLRFAPSLAVVYCIFGYACLKGSRSVDSFTTVIFTIRIFHEAVSNITGLFMKIHLSMPSLIYVAKVLNLRQEEDKMDASENGESGQEEKMDASESGDSEVRFRSCQLK